MIEQSEQLNELGAALAKAQVQIKSALKDSVNPHFKSRYADLTAIVEASRAALTSNGIALLQLPMCDPENGRVIVSTMLLHSSGQWIRSAASALPRDLSPQSVGSAITYLRRYGLAAMAGVVSEEDDDAQAAQPTTAASTNTSGMASAKQIGAIRGLCRELDRKAEDAADYYYHCKLEALTVLQASELITKLTELKAKL